MSVQETRIDSSSPRSPAEVRLRQIERITHFLDDSLKVPGTNFRIGWDAVIGLIPGVGDLATAGVSVYLVYQALQLGASKWAIARMLGNVGLDLAVGAIPILGDAFDATFKSNRRNARLLKRDLERRLEKAQDVAEKR